MSTGSCLTLVILPSMFANDKERLRMAFEDIVLLSPDANRVAAGSSDWQERMHPKRNGCVGYDLPGRDNTELP